MTKYKWTFWNRHEWFMTDCWGSYENTARRFPQCVAKAEEVAEIWIQAGTQTAVNIPSSRGKFGTVEQEDCVEHYLAQQLFYRWFEKTEEFKRAEAGTKKQIDGYYRQLAEDPEYADSVLTEEEDSFLYRRKVEKIEQMKKEINRR